MATGAPASDTAVVSAKPSHVPAWCTQHNHTHSTFTHTTSTNTHHTHDIHTHTRQSHTRHPHTPHPHTPQPHTRHIHTHTAFTHTHRIHTHTPQSHTPQPHTHSHTHRIHTRHLQPASQCVPHSRVSVQLHLPPRPPHLEMRPASPGQWSQAGGREEAELQDSRPIDAHLCRESPGLERTSQQTLPDRQAGSRSNTVNSAQPRPRLHRCKANKSQPPPEPQPPSNLCHPPCRTRLAPH